MTYGDQSAIRNCTLGERLGFGEGCICEIHGNNENNFTSLAEQSNVFSTSLTATYIHVHARASVHVFTYTNTPAIDSFLYILALASIEDSTLQ